MKCIICMIIVLSIRSYLMFIIYESIIYKNKFHIILKKGLLNKPLIHSPPRTILFKKNLSHLNKSAVLIFIIDIFYHSSYLLHINILLSQESLWNKMVINLACSIYLIIIYWYLNFLYKLSMSISIIIFHLTIQNVDVF